MPQKVSLFVPCFVDQLLPEVAVDTVKVLRRIGYAVEFPEDQTCCGQPAFNTGYWNEARPCAEHFVRVFKHAEFVVCPSGSCATMVRTFYADLLANSLLRDDAIAVASRTFELSEFLVKVAGGHSSRRNFPTRGYLSRFLPRICASFTCATSLCSFCARWHGLKLVEMARSEECCGFGGTFAISSPTSPPLWEIRKPKTWLLPKRSL